MDGKIQLLLNEEEWKVIMEGKGTNAQAQSSTDMIFFDGENVDAEKDSEFYELRRQALAFSFMGMLWNQQIVGKVERLWKK
jgi:hypothetical protein